MTTRMIDLIPEDTRRERAVFRRTVCWVAIAAAVAVAVSSVGTSMWIRTGKLDAQLEPLRTRVAAMEGWEQKVTPLMDKLKSAQQRNAAVGRLLDEPFWSGLLSDIAGASGENVLLGQITISKEIVNEKGKPSQELVHLAMSGVAPSNPELLGLLSKLESSKNIKSVSLERSAVKPQEPSADATESSGPVSFDVRGVVQ